MLNIVIPMAGAGSRFSKAGYVIPKPLLSIHGVPMIEMVIANVRPSQPHRFIFICQGTHVNHYGLAGKLHKWAPNCAIIQVDGLTEGAACSVLAAKDLINRNAPLMIVNSDQYVDISMDAYLRYMDEEKLQGLIMTMTSKDSKWSFVDFNLDNLVTRVAEKEVISNQATVGIYNFRDGRDFVRAAELMIAKNLRINGEFYVAPTYNQLIALGQRVGFYNVGKESAGMYGLGTPEDFESFLKVSPSFSLNIKREEECI